MNPTVVTDVVLPTLNTSDGRTVIKNLVITALLWGFALLIRTAVARYLRSKGLDPTDLRKLMSTTRNVIVAILLAATATVWFDELRTFAVSLVAVAAAIVIATKELIMGGAGTFLRTSSRMFDIGDRVELLGLRGDVIDTTLFTTTILEIGPGKLAHVQTGRAITVPNAMLLTTPVINESYSSPFLVHAMEVPVPREQVLDKEAKLRAACEAETTAFMADAEAYFAKRMRERGLEQPHLAPRLLIRLDDAVKATFVVTFVCPARRRGYVEQAILRRFLNDSATAEAPSPAPVADGAEP